MGRAEDLQRRILERQAEIIVNNTKLELFSNLANLAVDPNCSPGVFEAAAKFTKALMTPPEVSDEKQKST